MLVLLKLFFIYQLLVNNIESYLEGSVLSDGELNSTWQHVIDTKKVLHVLVVLKRTDS